MIIIENYSNELIEKDGILFAKKESNISYPESGNEEYFKIEEDSFWFKHRNNCIIESVKKYCPENLFFDIGGGNGFVAKGLEEKGISTVLIEPGIQGCINAQKRKLKNIVCSTLENASFKKESISAIGLFDVVEHIEDDIDFLNSIHSYLKENGFVFITVPAFKLLWSNEDDDAGHYRRYTLESLEKLLRGIGFQIVYSSYIFSILIIPIFVFRTIPSFLGFNKKSSNINKHRNEHKSKNGGLDRVLNNIWNKELERIKYGKKIPFGSSCFAVAKKITN